MTPQEIFDKVALHLLNQKGRSTLQHIVAATVGLAKGCAYRGDEGRMCAVGVLIPDELYNKGMEGLGVDQLVKQYIYLPDYFKKNIHLLAALQAVHDTSRDYCRYGKAADALREVARAHSLLTDVINTWEKEHGNA